ncbi:predicted protein [Lichtheimia corymbifera JMRC:FSU:9682]|uniref:Uncharacterized protein n=1 Tax=Lichtheimia corymbifera JMRC:FSU:9682 TaxID=1263082 RepID=A0A068SAM8_9FUNG|nr:predicted protein [Lichtheimia corymbifera JMRC:FSU:9682]
MLALKAYAVVVISHCVYGRLNLLDDGTYLWQQHDIDLRARTLYGWLNGKQGVGSIMQDHLINQPYNETAAAAHNGSDGYKAICKHQEMVFGIPCTSSTVLSRGDDQQRCLAETVRLMLRPQGFKNASSVRTAPSLRLLISLPLERKMDISIEQHVVGSTAHCGAKSAVEGLNMGHR